jgi:hypothetical protein
MACYRDSFTFTFCNFPTTEPTNNDFIELNVKILALAWDKISE